MPGKLIGAALLLVSLAGLARALPADAQEAAGQEPGRVRIGAADLTFSGRLQTQLNTTSVEQEPATEWLMRRVRLEARVRVNELLSGKIQPDFSGNRFTLKDAYVQLDFSPAVQLRAGQAHRPFGLLTRFSSLRMPPIEKGAEIRGIRAWDEVNLLKELGYSNRDVGVLVFGAPRGAPLGLEYEAALLQGPDGDRITQGAAPQLVTRVAVSPLDGVTLGASWSRRDFAGPAAGPAAHQARTGHAVALDVAVEPETPGLLLLGEITAGDADPWTDTGFRGAQVWLAYDLVMDGGRVTMVEPLFRLSRGELDGAEPAGGTLVTPGINLYLGGLNRAMFNYEVWFPHSGEEAARSFKAMMQLAF